MTTPAQCTPLCRAFLAALEDLCRHYQVHITPSGYDTLQIWPRHCDDAGGFDWRGIEDCTHEGGSN
jgi:hypothetical protein